MDFSALVPEVAHLFGLQPTTFVFLVLCVNVAARATARAIPNDATGFKGFIRQISAILGAEVSSRITSGVTMADVAKAALETPPIPEKVEVINEEEK